MAAVKDNPGVIAPPPLLYAAALGLGLALDFLVLRVATGMPVAVRYTVAAVLAGAGLVLGVAALSGFRRAGTHPEPWHPTTAIVTAGVYRFTRNPMYVGMTLLYLAVAIASDSVVTLAFVIPLLFVVRYGVIAREERYLEGKFGDAYRRYKASVRRWL